MDSKETLRQRFTTRWQRAVYGSVHTRGMWDLVNYHFQQLHSLERALAGRKKRVKVAGRLYPPRWLAIYAFIRGYQDCVVICSDFTNRYTGERIPIVRDLDLDRELLQACGQLRIKPNHYQD